MLGTAWSPPAPLLLAVLMRRCLRDANDTPGIAAAFPPPPLPLLRMLPGRLLRRLLLAEQPSRGSVAAMLAAGAGVLPWLLMMAGVLLLQSPLWLPRCTSRDI